MTRATQDKENNKRLIEKSLRLQYIVEQMRERGEPEDVIHDVRIFKFIQKFFEFVLDFLLRPLLL